MSPAKKCDFGLLNSAQLLLLLVIPVVLFFSSLNTILDRDKVWYGGGYDPEYAYLFNAMNMATFRLAGHYDHPGTTMQVYGGLVLRGVWLTEPAGAGNVEKVIANPEHYLRILNIATAVLGVLAVFLLGFIVLKRTGNFGYALIVQLTPFVSGFVLFNGFTRYTQEAMQMIAALGFAVALIDRSVNADRVSDRKSFTCLGWIAGLGMASKILFAPLLIIPLIIAPKNKYRLRFLLFSVISFLVFTLPIIRLYPAMMDWIVKLFLFSGQYGSGPAGLVDTATYPQNLLWIIKANPILAGVMALGIAMLIAGGIAALLKRTFITKSDMRLLFSVVVAIFAGYVIIAKSPKEAYLLPYEMLTPVVIVVFLKTLLNIRILIKTEKVITAVIAVAVSLLLVPHGIAGKESLYSSGRNYIWESSWQAAAGLGSEGALLLSNPGSSPVTGLYFGNAYSRMAYAEQMRNIYPGVYQFNLYTNKVNQMGNDTVAIPELLEKYRTLFIQAWYSDEAQVRKALADAGALVQDDYFYGDEGQVILVAVAPGSPEAGLIRKMIFSSAETPKGNPDARPSADGIAVFGELSAGKGIFGYNSIVTNPESPYAFTSEPLVLNEGDSIRAVIYAKGAINSASLVIAESEPREVLLTQYPSEPGDDGVAGISAGFRNDEPRQRTVIVYAWNGGEKEVWFDNYSIEIFKKIN